MATVSLRLEQWEQHCLNRLLVGQAAHRAPETRGVAASDAVPPELQRALAAGLAVCRTREQVQTIFAAARYLAPTLEAPTLERSAEWDESKHPRDEDGKWTNGSGASLAQLSLTRPLSQDEWNADAALGHTYPDPHDISPLCQQVRKIHRQAQFESDIHRVSKQLALDNIRSVEQELKLLRATPEASRPASGKTRIAQLNSKWMEHVQAFEEAKTEVDRLEAKERSDIHRAIVGSDAVPLQLDYTLTANATFEEHERLKEGLGLFNQLLWRAPIAPQNITVTPSTDEEGSQAETAPIRSRFDPTTMTIELGTQFRDQTVVHELGHWLETTYPAVLKAAVEHHAWRTAGEKAKTMRQATDNANYSDEELTKPDHFYTPYMGKWYADEAGNIIGTEIISGGLGLLAFEPGDLAQRDPITFDFICRMLGALPRNLAAVAPDAEPPKTDLFNTAP